MLSAHVRTGRIQPEGGAYVLVKTGCAGIEARAGGHAEPVTLFFSFSISTAKRWADRDMHAELREGNMLIAESLHVTNQTLKRRLKSLWWCPVRRRAGNHGPYRGEGIGTTTIDESPEPHPIHI
jgi:hypothetical protein